MSIRIWLKGENPDEKATAALESDESLQVETDPSHAVGHYNRGLEGGILGAELPLTILSSILPSFVHLLLPSLVCPFTPPWRLQLLLEEREREEREEVVEEVEDARFVRASTLLLPFTFLCFP